MAQAMWKLNARNNQPRAADRLSPAAPLLSIKPITPALVAAYKSTRLRALYDTPTAFGSTYASESQLTDADWLRRTQQWNDGDGSVAYLAWDDAEPDQPCGIAASVLLWEDPRTAELLSMWVAPSHRRRGVGRLLVEGVSAWAKSRQARTLCLMVTSSNDDAMRFYETLGFTKTGRTAPYPNDATLFEFEMARTVTSVS
jgi:ribosomal protein S18 acetylase RimI-like enzyme